MGKGVIIEADIAIPLSDNVKKEHIMISDPSVKKHGRDGVVYTLQIMVRNGSVENPPRLARSVMNDIIEDGIFGGTAEKRPQKSTKAPAPGVAKAGWVAHPDAPKPADNPVDDVSAGAPSTGDPAPGRGGGMENSSIMHSSPHEHEISMEAMLEPPHNESGPCKGECVQYRATRPKTGDRYSSGQVRCATCDIFITLEGVLDGNRCRCCNKRVRMGPRARELKQKIRERPVESLVMGDPWVKNERGGEPKPKRDGKKQSIPEPASAVSDEAGEPERVKPEDLAKLISWPDDSVFEKVEKAADKAYSGMPVVKRGRRKKADVGSAPARQPKKKRGRPRKSKRPSADDLMPDEIVADGRRRKKTRVRIKVAAKPPGRKKGSA